MNKRRGFTLIELLVVIAIIALLMAILMPALARVRKQAQAVACMANLKQWALSFAMYCENNEGRFPNRDGCNEWMEVLLKYYNQHDLRLCPTATATLDEGARPPFNAFIYPNQVSESDEGRGSYGINLWTSDREVSEDDSQAFWRTPDVKGGDTNPVFFDSKWKDCDPLHKDDPPEHEGDDWEANENELKRPCANRHGNGIMQMLFMDWSVQKVGLKQLWELDWHRDWNPRNDVPPDWESEAPWMKDFKDYYLY